MVSKDEIVEKLNAMQQAKAKAKVYEDVIASVAKYEAMLERKHSDAKKRCERLGKADKSSQAYMSALNDSVMLQIQIVEARRILAGGNRLRDALPLAGDLPGGRLPPALCAGRRRGHRREQQLPLPLRKNRAGAGAYRMTCQE